MYSLKRLGLLLAAFVCILVMIFGLARFAIEVGESPTRYVVQDAAVALAGLLGLVFCWRRSKQLKADREAAEANTPAFTGQRFEADARVLPQVLGLALFAAMAALALGWLFTAPGLAAGAVSLLLVGTTVLLGVMAASQHRGGRATLQMDGHGLDHAWFGRIPWDQVHGLSFKEIEIKHSRIFSMSLGVKDPDRYVAQMPWVVRLMQSRWGRSGTRTGALEIPLNPLDQPARSVYAAAWALRHRVQPAPIGHWYPGMTDADVALITDMNALMADIERMSPEQAMEQMQAMEPRLHAARERGLQAGRRDARILWLLIVGMVLAGLLPFVLIFLRDT